MKDLNVMLLGCLFELLMLIAWVIGGFGGLLVFQPDHWFMKGLVFVVFGTISAGLIKIIRIFTVVSLIAKEDADNVKKRK